MGQQKNNGVVRQCRPTSLRRGFIPEPSQVGNRPRNHVHYPRRCSNESRYFNFTHTSCIMAIRNYVEKMHSTNHKKKRNIHFPTNDNAERLICSLKNDIKVISEIEEDAANNPSKKPSSDPCFVLSAMMCKVNKLENILLSQPDCREQLARRKNMIMMAKCIKKSLLEQAHCEEQLLQEKQRKTICLVKSLDMFEKDVRCATKDIKRVCCPKTSEAKCPIESPKPCINRSSVENRCQPSYAMKHEMESPCKNISVIDECTETSIVPQPCPKKYDITGLKLTYTKSRLIKENDGKEREEVDSQVSCEMNEDEKCKIMLFREGCPTPFDECNPILKQKMNNLSRIWMESARQLIDTCSTYDTQCC